MSIKDTIQQFTKQFHIGRFVIIAIPYLWLLFFFLTPFFIVFKISFSEIATAIPPYRPVFYLHDGLADIVTKLKSLSFDNYLWLFEDTIYIKAYISSLKIAIISTFLTLLIAYPLAYAIARAPRYWQPMLLMLIILPFWTSFLIRVYAWIGILKPEGLLTAALQMIGLLGEDQQLHILNTDIAVYIGIVYSYLPFMALPLYASLEKLDETLLEAAADLGCPAFRAFWTITFPLSLPGVIAGSFLVFIPAVGEFVIPDLLGGSDTLMIGKTLWSEFFNNRDWPVASAVSILLLFVLVIPIVMFRHHQHRHQELS